MVEIIYFSMMNLESFCEFLWRQHYTFFLLIFHLKCWLFYCCFRVEKFFLRLKWNTIIESMHFINIGIWKIQQKHGKVLGHLGLVNYSSEMNNNQNNLQIIFILLFQVNSIFLNFCQTTKFQWTNADPNSTIETLSGIFIVEFEHEVFLLLTLNKYLLVKTGIRLNFLKKNFHVFLTLSVSMFPFGNPWTESLWIFFRGYEIGKLVSERLIFRCNINYYKKSMFPFYTPWKY